MQTRTTAHYRRNIGQWRNRCVLITQQGYTSLPPFQRLETPEFNVYVYIEDGMREEYVKEVRVKTLEAAMAEAMKWDVDPSALEVTDDNYNPIIRWSV